jgi:flagellar protein FliO/FliZ
MLNAYGMRIRLSGCATVALLAGLWPWPALAADGQELGLGMLMVKSVAALAAVLALFALVVWLMRRVQGGGGIMPGKSPMQLEYRMNLDNRNAIAIVRCDGQRWLVGISPAGLTRIDRLPPADEARPSQEPEAK